MGVIPTIDYDMFPRQGDLKGKRVAVCFRYAIDKELTGTVIRNDMEDPFRTIIVLDDGRAVLATECQWRPLP